MTLTKRTSLLCQFFSLFLKVVGADLWLNDIKAGYDNTRPHLPERLLAAQLSQAVSLLGRGRHHQTAVVSTVSRWDGTRIEQKKEKRNQTALTQNHTKHRQRHTHTLASWTKRDLPDVLLINSGQYPEILTETVSLLTVRKCPFYTGKFVTAVAKRWVVPVPSKNFWYS